MSSLRRPSTHTMTKQKRQPTAKEEIERRLLQATTPAERERLRRLLEKFGSREGAEKR